MKRSLLSISTFITFAVCTVLFVIALSGCAKMVNGLEDGDYVKSDFAVMCLDGTEYWTRKVGHSSYMAVRIDRETRQPKECES